MQNSQTVNVTYVAPNGDHITAMYVDNNATYLPIMGGVQKYRFSSRQFFDVVKVVPCIAPTCEQVTGNGRYSCD